LSAKIVIIEDDSTVAAVERELLEQQGYSVSRASNGKEGAALVESVKPDIVVLDIVLPDMNGLDLLRDLVQLPEAHRPHVIVLSGHEDSEVFLEALEIGAADFLRKPFMHREFILRVSALLQMRAYRDASEASRKELADDLRKLSRYFSRETITAILDGTIADTLSGEIMTTTVMMFDLRNSTGLGEQMVPALFFQFLTAFFGQMSDIVYKCGGSISKFTGDGFLATFGLRDYSIDATRGALRCAILLREHIANYNKRRPPYLKDPVGYGVGITTGELYAGNVGSVHKLEYTIFGDAVNLAARLESMTKAAGVDILIDQKTRVIGGARLHVKKMQTSSVRGKSESVTMYYPESFDEG